MRGVRSAVIDLFRIEGWGDRRALGRQRADYPIEYMGELREVLVGSVMPAVFVGHGSPMNALGVNRYTRAWAEFGQRVRRPDAVLAISAHWYTRGTAVTGMASPRTIHDFLGFGAELENYDYPAPGSPSLAQETAELLAPVARVAIDEQEWGLDHGTWSVLAHMFPRSDVPVVQLSIDASKSPSEHLELGAALAPLCEDGVLILASGNVVHNLARMSMSMADRGFEWAERFDSAATELMSQRPQDITTLFQHAEFEKAAPTQEHLLPLLYLAGLATARETNTTPFATGYAMGSLSMTCHALEGP